MVLSFTCLIFFSFTGKSGKQRNDSRWDQPQTGSMRVTPAVSTFNKATIRTDWTNNPVVISRDSNQPPTITLTSPTNGSVTVTNQTFTAKASDVDGHVTQVNFYTVSQPLNGQVTRTLLGSDNTEPYTFTWLNIPSGSYNIQAEAVDNSGANTFSAGAKLTVLEAISVIITTNLKSQNYVAGSNIKIDASVSSQTSRTITKVEFYAHSTKIGEDLDVPYSINWANAPAGNYAISAKAIDNTGASWSSPLYLISIANATVPIVAESTLFTLNLSPNPAQYEVLMNSNVPKGGNYRLSILDLTGKVVLNNEITCIKGANSDTINISKLPIGMYLVRIRQIGAIEYALHKLVIE